MEWDKGDKGSDRVVYVVMRWIADAPEGGVGDLMGVFSTREKAESVCRDWYDSFWPITLDEDLGDERVAPPGARYPVYEKWCEENGKTPEYKNPLPLPTLEEVRARQAKEREEAAADGD